MSKYQHIFEFTSKNRNGILLREEERKKKTKTFFFFCFSTYSKIKKISFFLIYIYIFLPFCFVYFFIMPMDWNQFASLYCNPSTGYDFAFVVIYLPVAAAVAVVAIV